jgi:hypothetical protein
MTFGQKVGIMDLEEGSTMAGVEVRLMAVKNVSMKASTTAGMGITMAAVKQVIIMIALKQLSGIVLTEVSMTAKWPRGEAGHIPHLSPGNRHGKRVTSQRHLLQHNTLCKFFFYFPTLENLTL